MKYREWLKIWLDNYVQPSSKARTYEHYEYLCRTHVAPCIGDAEMREITPVYLQMYISRLLSEGNSVTGCGLASNTVNTVITLMQGSFRAAFASGEIDHDPSEKIKRPKKTGKKVECFSVGDQKRIESAVICHNKPKMFGIILCLYTGMRIGEALALEWSDVNLDKGLIYVTKSCRDNKSGVGGKRIVDTPKTVNSTRVIPVPKQLIPMLKQHKAESGGRWIISEDGEPVTVRSYQRSFELLLKRIGVEHKGFHALRHTFATRAIECGMDVKSLSEILGHKNPTVTLELYVHSLMEHKKEMMDRIGQAL